MGACGSKSNVLKEQEGDAPVTRELEPIETLVAESNNGAAAIEKDKEVIEAVAVDVKEAETCVAAQDVDDNSGRQCLRVLLDEVQVQEASAASTEPEPKAAVPVVAAEKSDEVAAETKAIKPAEKVEPPAKVAELAAKAAEEPKVEEPEPPKKSPEEAKVEKPAAVAEQPVEKKPVESNAAAEGKAAAVDAKQVQATEEKKSGSFCYGK